MASETVTGIRGRPHHPTEAAGATPEAAVESTIDKANRDRQARKAVTARAAVDSNGQPVAQEQDHPIGTDDDGFMEMADGSSKVKLATSDSGKVMPVTQAPSGRGLIGNPLREQYAERMVADPAEGDAKELLAELFDVLGLMPLSTAKAVLQPYESDLCRILGIEYEDET